MQYFSQLPQIIQGLIVICGAVLLICTTLSGLFKAFGWSSGVAAMAALGADIAKLLAVLQGFQPANKPAEQVVKKQEAKTTTLLSLIAIALLLTGCTMSLESARSDGIVKRAAQTKSVPTAEANRAECQSLDNIQRYWGYGAITTGPISPLAAGVGAVPGVGDKTREAMLITAGIAGALTVFEMTEQKNFANQWAEQCSHSVGP